MADHKSKIITNSDLDSFVTKIIEDKDTRAIIFNVALADFEGQIGEEESGKYAEKLKTNQGNIVMELTPSDKIIGKIRKERKDIFVVGFKTTTNNTESEQYIKSLELLKKNSINLVLANDTVNRRNVIVAPEETKYSKTTNRSKILKFLTKMTVSRMQNKFTHSTVVEGDAIDWNGESVPENLSQISMI